MAGWCSCILAAGCHMCSPLGSRQLQCPLATAGWCRYILTRLRLKAWLIKDDGTAGPMLNQSLLILFLFTRFLLTTWCHILLSFLFLDIANLTFHPISAYATYESSLVLCRLALQHQRTPREAGYQGQVWFPVWISKVGLQHPFGPSYLWNVAH